MKTANLFGTPINTGRYTSFIERVFQLTTVQKGAYVCVLNVHMLIEGYRDKNFHKVIANADLVTPDGMPITWALRLLYGLRQDRVPGMTFLPDILGRAESEKTPIYFYGGSETLLESSKDYIQKNFDGLNVKGYYSPPFRKLTKSELKEDAQRINESGAKIVLVVLGCPKQEKWMSAIKKDINAVMVGVGGALPVMIGMKKRAPGWMQKAGLEWLFRFCLEPNRLFKRYAVTNSLFLFLLFKNMLKRSAMKRMPQMKAKKGTVKKVRRARRRLVS